MNPNNLSPIEQRHAKMRARMIEAGFELFLQSGFRGISMEAIAARAEVAKPTLYKYFSDKETLFSAGVSRFLADAKEVCTREFDRNNDAGGRIAGALAEKHKMFFRLVEGSAYAEELYSETARVSAKDFGEFERWLELRIQKTLQDSGEAKAHIYTHLILACALGIAKKSQRVEEIGPAIRLMVRKILA